MTACPHAAGALFTPAFVADPHPVYAALREEGRAHRVTLPGGVEAWLLTGYEDCRRAFLDNDSYSKRHGGHLDRLPRAARPRHRRRGDRHGRLHAGLRPAPAHPAAVPGLQGLHPPPYRGPRTEHRGHREPPARRPAAPRGRTGRPRRPGHRVRGPAADGGRPAPAGRARRGRGGCAVPWRR
ncbi:cytochrome P450 [Streptomyces tricolor]|nr:cytochrome P450 [Streptomyces tricolor]